jgi:hypothetical protein
MPNYIFETYGFVTLTGSDAMTISGSEGWKYISIKVTSGSSTSATVTSDYVGNLGGKINGSINLAAGESLNIGTGENSVSGVTITAPSGCTVEVTGVKFQQVIG